MCKIMDDEIQYVIKTLTPDVILVCFIFILITFTTMSILGPGCANHQL